MAITAADAPSILVPRNWYNPGVMLNRSIKNRAPAIPPEIYVLRSCLPEKY